ncbi:hypothetical protein CIPAW_05G211000 [Carya illinoinensis]|uniref:Uncharacterized protein n=1 Tax=Carya illinoinensis TaxID=32201 RepID=A0A8T1QKL5_CARIL|nr:hypothetical protein CIPAW_05G211000 [Carya illinoinensis]KAG6655360.1 hypothetical protein CIPAW_05G211000 [Carya illinoinensis]
MREGTCTLGKNEEAERAFQNHGYESSWAFSLWIMTRRFRKNFDLWKNHYWFISRRQGLCGLACIPTSANRSTAT